MATLESDVPMIPAGEGPSSVPPPLSSSSAAASSSSKEPKRSQIKKWNAVALGAWDIVVHNCNHIMDLCIECQAKASATCEECTVAWDNSEWEFQKYGH